MQLGKQFRTIWMAAVAAAILLYASTCEEDQWMEFIIHSSAFGEKEAMPNIYACGAGLSPPLSFSGIPDEVKSLVVIAEDPDRISGTYTQWMIWGLPPKIMIPQDIDSYPIEGAIMGTADDEKTVGYLAPCPPEGETHRIVFRAFGLDEPLDLAEGSSRTQLDAAMKGFIVAKAVLTAKAAGP